MPALRGNTIQDLILDWFKNHFTGGSANIFASATSSGAVTKDDDTVLDYNALYIGGAGNISIDHTEGGTAVVYVGLLAGSILPVSGVRVNAATTAESIVWMKW